MKLSSKTLSPVLVLAVFVFGCSLFNQKPQVVTGTDGKSQLTVPGTWNTQTDLNDNATIQVGNVILEQFTIVISESKEDFATLDFDDYIDIIRRSAKQTLTDAVLTESRSITVNGYPAVQFEVDGSVARIKAKWLYTLVDAPKNYHQVLAWSSAAKYEKNKPVFVDVVNSFKEIDGAASVPPPPPGSPKR